MNVEKRKRAIALNGGSCVRCGYKKYYGALEFHHRHPSFTWANTCKFGENKKLMARSWKTLETKLVDDYELVCSNCHKQIHNYIMVYHKQHNEG